MKLPSLMEIFLNHIKVQLKEKNTLIYSIDIDKVNDLLLFDYVKKVERKWRKKLE